MVVSDSEAESESNATSSSPSSSVINTNATAASVSATTSSNDATAASLDPTVSSDSINSPPAVTSSSKAASAIESDPLKLVDLVSMSEDEIKKIIETKFNEEQHVHNYFLCKEKCCDTMKLEAIFKHIWLSRKYWWIIRVEGFGTFCALCTKHKIKHKSKTIFVHPQPSTNCKSSPPQEHHTSNVHLLASKSEQEQLYEDYTKATQQEPTVLEKVFNIAYFIMKEHLPNKKFLPLLDLISHIGLKELDMFRHRSEGSVQEILLTLGDTLKKEIIEDLQKATALGLMVDEGTDVSTLAQLVMFVQYVTSENTLSVKFLSIRNVLEKFDSCSSEAIFQVIRNELEENCQVPVSKISGFCSDGAAVMTGKVSGVGKRLRECNPTCICIHCVCHRLCHCCIFT